MWSSSTAARRVRVVERRVARGLDVLRHLGEDRLEVGRHLRECVRLAEEIAELRRAVRLRLDQVVELQAELAGEISESLVTAVDQLATVLVDLAVGEVAATGPAAAADATRGFVDVGVEASLLETVRAGQPGEACTDHRDPRRRPSRSGGGDANCPRSDAPATAAAGRPASLRRRSCRTASSTACASGVRAISASLGCCDSQIGASPDRFYVRSARISFAARTPSAAPPSMKPWKSVEQCSPAKWMFPCRAFS